MKKQTPLHHSILKKERSNLESVKPRLGVLSRKWALPILADIGFRKINRFGEIRRSNIGLTPRMLSRRLRELEEGGFITKGGTNVRSVDWKLTKQGTDILPAVMNLIAYGARWNTNYQFRGRLPKIQAK